MTKVVHLQLLRALSVVDLYTACQRHFTVSKANNSSVRARRAIYIPENVQFAYSGIWFVKQIANVQFWAVGVRSESLRVLCITNPCQYIIWQRVAGQENCNSSPFRERHYFEQRESHG